MLSVVIVAWNEEKTLPRAIASVRTLADEIVVVDTQSTDNTVAVAKKLGCRVYSHKNTGVVEPVRNYSIGRARGDWILILDADEEVPAALANKIRAVIEGEADYYRIPRKNIIFGRWIKSSHWWPDYVYRLFKKDHVTWSEVIHSVPQTRGLGADLEARDDLAIVHHHYSSIGQYVERLNRYTDYQKQAVVDRGYIFSGRDLVLRPIDEFFRQFFSRQGYRDGIHGLALASLQAFSELVLYSKIWQDHKFASMDVDLAGLQQDLQVKAREFVWWKYQVEIDQSGIIGKIVWKLRRKLGL